MNSSHIFRVASLLAVLAAGSCAAPMNDPEMGLADDPMVNHPIQVQPNYRSLKVSFYATSAGLMPDDSQKFDAFVADYMQHGSGAISISAAPGTDASAAIGYFGERLANAGIPRDRIIVGQRQEGPADHRVEIGFISYTAVSDTCGDWSVNAGYSASNRVSPNLGCATQANVAAMVADPRDLIAPRDMGAGDAARRATVYDNYRAGKPTGAEHSTEQSGAVSDVGGKQ
ncbi:MAG: CpaD family pilus assembly protein [Alphaproteobacteria bacterium]|nr:CpaD family pilus assembly protein [Alphaproteobacteria bacterium]MBV9540043.1 CpaD family pilus assembly protein [Alphaproteobacteria bacterium]